MHSSRSTEQDREYSTKRLTEILNNHLLPSVRQGRPLELFLARPPMVLVPPSVTVWPAPTPIPTEGDDLLGRPEYLYHKYWRSEGLEMLRFPVVGAVFDGEGDYRFGNQIATVRAVTFFLVPPAVSQPDGSQPHWLRAGIERARNSTFWLVILPSGAFCFACRTEQQKHCADARRLFLVDHKIGLLAELLLEEVERGSQCQWEIARSYLLALLLCVRRALQTTQILTTTKGLAPHSDLATGKAVVQRACAFIQAHLHETLTLKAIAARAYSSPAHLERLFRAELGVSVKQYLTRCRIERAETLLADTDLPVREIGQLVGFAYPTYFSRVFARHTGLSPTRYRQERRQSCSPK